jgi:hypothetical protein
MVDGVSTLRCGRQVGGSIWALNLLADGGRWHAVERGARLKGLHGVDEGGPGEPGDVVDDVTAGVAPKAVEPLGYPADRKGRRGVVVEGAAAHEGMAALSQLDTTCRHDDLDRVVVSNVRNVKASAIGERHGSTPQPIDVSVATSWVGASR